MSGIPGAGSEAAAIHSAFAEAVQYCGAGLLDEEIPAVRSDSAADAFQGPGGTLRQTGFEIRFDDLPESPRKGDRIMDAAGVRWLAIDITKRVDIDAWVVIVEMAQ